MADSSPPPMPSNSALPEEPRTQKRVHSYSRLTTALAVLALAIASYALWRLDAARERLEHVNDLARIATADRSALQAELRALVERTARSERELTTRFEALNELPQQVSELNTAVEDLRGRTEGPQRAWSRAEALFLMEIAQRSLVLDRDVATAIAALESADSRLAAVHDPALTSVRQQLATDLQALRATHVPDRIGVLTRLAAAETEATRIPVKGIVPVERDSQHAEDLPTGLFARARALIGRALASLIRVRSVDERGGSVVTLDEELVRRQHLQLSLFTARSALARRDQPTYRSALSSARQWISEFFDLAAPSTQALLKEIQLLEAIEIDPKLPNISKSTESLQRLTRGAP